MDGLYSEFTGLSPELLGALIKQSALTLCVDNYIQHLGAAVGGRVICLTPSHNKHAYHKNNMYISGNDYTNHGVNT